MGQKLVRLEACQAEGLGAGFWFAGKGCLSVGRKDPLRVAKWGTSSKGQERTVMEGGRWEGGDSCRPLGKHGEHGRADHIVEEGLNWEGKFGVEKNITEEQFFRGVCG